MSQNVGDSSHSPLEIPFRSWLTLATVSVAVFMVSIELTIISLALPKIRLAFDDTSEAALSWVINAYSIGVAALLLLSGWLADRHGRKRVFLTGLAVFAAGSVLAGTAVSAEMLIAARALQSVGGAMQYPAGMALLLTAFPRERHQMAVGAWGAMGGLAAALGPSLGGVLVDLFGWRAVFLVNVPVALAAIIFGPRFLTESYGDITDQRIDAVSVPLASLGVGAIILGIVQGQTWGWASPALLGAFAAGVVMIAAFAIQSLRHPAPLFEPRLLRLRSYTIGNIGTALFCLAFFSMIVPLPTYLQRAWGWSVLETGFAIAPGSFLAFLIAPWAGRLADRIGNAPILTFGSAVGAAGLLWFRIFIGTDVDFGHLLVGNLLVGVAAGLGFAQLTGAAVRDIPPGKYAQAVAGRTTIFQLSVALAVAVGFAIIGRPASDMALLDQYQIVWTIGALSFACLSAIFFFFYPRRRLELDEARAVIGQ